MAMLPPLRAVGRASIEIFGPVAWSGKWDEALWGSSYWGSLDWHDVTPESMVCQIQWGADDPAGVLTVPAAGSWNIDTYDPNRMLDPSNQSSPYANSLKPGKAIRVRVLDDDGEPQIVRQGLIDEVEYDIAEKKGKLRGTDLVPLIVNAKLDSGQNDDPNLPDTLRARAQYLLSKVGLDKLVPLEPMPIANDYDSFELMDANGEPTGWGASNSNFEIVRTQWAEGSSNTTPDGEYFCRFEHIGTAAATGGVALSTTSRDVVPLAKYRMSAWVWIGSGDPARQIRLVCRNYNDANTQLGDLYQQTFPMTTTGWTFIQTNEFEWPDDGVSTGFKIVALAVSSLPGEFFRIDSFRMEGPLPYDPPVGPLPNDQEASVWSLISTSAYDALYAMWMNRFGQLCFRSFGDPRNTGFTVGGDEGIPLSSIKALTSLENVYSAVHAHDMALTPPNDVVTATNPEAVDIYGLITLTRNKPVPSAQFWVDAVLADRAGASLQYETGTLYPRTFEELLSILDLGMIDIMHLVADDISPTLGVDARVLGGAIMIDTSTGFSATVMSYIPGDEWEAQQEPPPIEPPVEPEPPETQKVQRIYDAVKDTRAARTSGGANYGSGTEGEIPVGSWQGWRNRAFIDFADIPFGDVVSIDKATLELDTTTQVNVGFGSSPKVVVKRVTAAWNEGTLSSPGSANATVYPGPAVSSSDQVTASISKAENAATSIVITGIARRWQEGQLQAGVGLFSAGEDNNAYTTEFWTRENSTASRRPRLVLDLTVEVPANA